MSSPPGTDPAIHFDLSEQFFDTWKSVPLRLRVRSSVAFLSEIAAAEFLYDAAPLVVPKLGQCGYASVKRYGRGAGILCRTGFGAGSAVSYLTDVGAVADRWKSGPFVLAINPIQNQVYPDSNFARGGNIWSPMHLSVRETGDFIDGLVDIPNFRLDGAIQ
jgi:hypothetical protein